MGKAILCACEDVTLDDVRRAFEKGHRDIESVKRYTGFGTGPCQAKSCLALIARELLRLGATPTELEPFTARPPVDAMPLAALAAIDPATLPIVPGVPLSGAHGGAQQQVAGERGRAVTTPSCQRAPGAPVRAARERAGALAASPDEPASGAPRPSSPLPGKASIVIIGGGIMGLGLAYQLAKRGTADVVVLERGYLNAGASGRNGGGVRMQWTTPTMVRLAKRSIELMRGFATELGVNVWLRQGGYLFLAPTRAQVERLERNIKVHEAEGLRTRILSPMEALEVTPELDPSSFVAAAYNPDDGTVFPWPFLYGYAQRAEALGAKICTFTGVTGFRTSGASITHVETDRGPIACDTVVLAAGAWSKEIAALAGVSVPNRPTRHEILVTESMKPWLDPLVSMLGNGLYFSQSQRGEIVGGMGDPLEPEGVEERSTLRFLARFARAITTCAPVTGGIKVVRQWAGCYDVTPDNNPILGAAGFGNFLQLHGWVGHGFMMAPAVTELMAEWMTGGRPHELFERFTIDRFSREGGAAREDFIIG
ncbi:MAG TPA: FAD-dependent oxidoreductase [Anaeromyxobacteraceae bacterium]|nr:FAD-dependent oxidoreductase [Anaeromyxobacteraceae bacterium]